MKKIMIVAIIVMAVILILGISWGKLFKRGYTIQSYEKAIEWYSKSADKGNAYAKEALERIRNSGKVR